MGKSRQGRKVPRGGDCYRRKRRRNTRQFEVTKIWDRRTVDGEDEYLLQWKGHRKNESTWVPLENLNCPDLLEDFLEHQRNRDQVSSATGCETLAGESSVVNISNASPFEVLPMEMKYEIFNWLSSDEKKNCRLVCTEWRNTLDTSFVSFKASLSDANVASVQEFTGCFDEIRVLELRNTQKWNVSNSFKKLIFQNTQGSRSVVRDNMIGLLKSSGEIRTLIFKKGSIDDSCTQPLPVLTFELLTHLKIRLKDNIFGPKDIPSFDLFASLEAPRLVTLNVVVDENPDDFRYLYIGLYSLVAKFSRSIRNLKIFFSRFYFYNSQSEFTKTLKDIRQTLTSNLKLSSLRLVIDRFEGQDGASLALDILSSQKNLQYLELRLNVVDHKVETSIQQAILKNSESLRKFCMHRCICNIRNEFSLGCSNAVSVMLSGIANCVQLQTLQLYFVGQELKTFPTPLPASVRNLAIKANVSAKALHDLVKFSRSSALEYICLIDTDRMIDKNEEETLNAVHFVLESFPSIKEIEFQNPWINNNVAFENFPQVRVLEGHRQKKVWHYGRLFQFHL